MIIINKKKLTMRTLLLVTLIALSFITADAISCYTCTQSTSGGSCDKGNLSDSQKYSCGSTYDRCYVYTYSDTTTRGCSTKSSCDAYDQSYYSCCEGDNCNDGSNAMILKQVFVAAFVSIAAIFWA